jgi:hypothetical protein
MPNVGLVGLRAWIFSQHFEQYVSFDSKACQYSSATLFPHRQALLGIVAFPPCIGFPPLPLPFAWFARRDELPLPAVDLAFALVGTIEAAFLIAGADNTSGWTFPLPTQTQICLLVCDAANFKSVFMMMVLIFFGSL